MLRISQAGPNGITPGRLAIGHEFYARASLLSRLFLGDVLRTLGTASGMIPLELPSLNFPYLNGPQATKLLSLKPSPKDCLLERCGFLPNQLARVL